jgi:uncharacterized protein involved in exopolysaccharide biosynthesis/Mrp family chromosome partitioning ATPase
VINRIFNAEPESAVLVSPPSVSTEPPAMSLSDIYYTLFRHKWRILLCTLAGAVLAAAIYFLHPPPYRSEAKLFVRYVVTDGRTPAPPGDEAKAKSPDKSGETIMDSEQEILTSLDLSRQVAEVVGPERILGDGLADLDSAAASVRKSLTVEIPPQSSIIRIEYRHPDPDVVQPVLRELIARYLKLHVDIHRATGMVGEFLGQETEQLRGRLARTEAELRETTKKAGVISIDDARKEAADETARLQREIHAAEAQAAEHNALLERATRRIRPDATAASPAAPAASLSVDRIDQYRTALSRIEQLRRREDELRLQFTDGNSRVREIHSRLLESQAAAKAMSDEFPQLLDVYTPPVISGGAGQVMPAMINPDFEADKVAALAATITELASQLEETRAKAARLDEIQGTISELRRRKDLEEANYRYYAANLEQSRINEALGAGKISNISQVQAPSPPRRDWAKTYKAIGIVLAAGILGGFAWAFLIELYLDTSVRRPSEVEALLGVPLLLSILDSTKKGYYRPRHFAGRNSSEHAFLSETMTRPKSDNGLNGHDEPSPSSLNATALNPFYETLRDRLIGYFDNVNLTHSPKLVAITGLGRGSGVTTIATGLASCLSKTGEGNVLLVDMTAGQGSAQQYYKGSRVRGLDELLETPMIQPDQRRHYVVADGRVTGKLAPALPRRFNELLPKLKASEFDYIIFDMPPVSQLSITPRVAKFMDMVMMVIESEKTDRDLAQRATTLLTGSKAHITAVLNKTCSYLPERMHNEFLGNS